MRAHHRLPLTLLRPACSPGHGGWVGVRLGGCMARPGECCPLGSLDEHLRVFTWVAEESPCAPPPSLPGKGRTEGQHPGCAVPRAALLWHCPVTAPRVAVGPRGLAGSSVPSDGRGDTLHQHEQLLCVPGSPGPQARDAFIVNLFNGVHLSKTDNPCFSHLMLKVCSTLKTSCRNNFEYF